MIQRAFSFKKWIEENRHLLRPPVGNQVVYKHTNNFIVMVVGGPNARKDYHYNETEEFFYQLEGDIVVKIIEDGKFVDIPIKEGEIFLLPPRVPHSPQRGPNTIGLVMEIVRPDKLDGFQWYCEQCGNLLYETRIPVKDIVKDLPVVMESFYSSEELRTCKKCGAVMQPPPKLN
ncbi:MAG: 3-hydroxyanthranilate 3,4-dioxygenase [Chitinophagales bacterium]|nr:3-hydroxyanthranilate 3,4-dioxygenase [Chitinophagales bacterium]MDW8427759.1 3-hydroxyanthranilate 3,4-dioxygenase [Chitinophagales bacterium]